MCWATSVSVGRLVTPLSVAIHRSNHCYLYFSFITLAGWWRQKDFIFETASNPKDESFDLITESRVATSSNVSTHQNNLETKYKKMFTVVWFWWTSDYVSLREYIYIYRWSFGVQITIDSKDSASVLWYSLSPNV